MAQRTIVSLIDDIDGSEADETIEFALDGSRYEIDLSQENASRLREAIAIYIANARRVNRTPGRAPSSSPSAAARPRSTATRPDREQTAAMREWARQNGHKVGDKGRIPAAIVEAYNAAH